VNEGEKDMKKSRITWISLAVAVILLGLVGVALATRGTSGSATESGSGAYANVTDPDALAELTALRTDFADAREAWAAEYNADRTSDEAQAAMQTLRDQYQADMQSVVDRYGIDEIAGSQTGGGGGQGGGQGGGMGGGMGMGLSAAD